MISLMCLCFQTWKTCSGKTLRVYVPRCGWSKTKELLSITHEVGTSTSLGDILVISEKGSHLRKVPNNPGQKYLLYFLSNSHSPCIESGGWRIRFHKTWAIFRANDWGAPASPTITTALPLRLPTEEWESQPLKPLNIHQKQSFLWGSRTHMVFGTIWGQGHLGLFNVNRGCPSHPEVQRENKHRCRILNMLLESRLALPQSIFHQLQPSTPEN